MDTLCWLINFYKLYFLLHGTMYYRTTSYTISVRIRVLVSSDAPKYDFSFFQIFFTREFPIL